MEEEDQLLVLSRRGVEDVAALREVRCAKASSPSFLRALQPRPKISIFASIAHDTHVTLPPSKKIHTVLRAVMGAAQDQGAHVVQRAGRMP